MKAGVAIVSAKSRTWKMFCHSVLVNCQIFLNVGLGLMAK